MKYLPFLIVICILLTGCNKQETPTKESLEYQKIVSELQEKTIEDS